MPYKTKENKNKQITRHRDRNREREPELTHLFKNNLFDISLYREFLYISHAGFFFMWGVSLTHPVLASFLCEELLLHILCWLHFYLGSFFTCVMLASFLCGEFLVHILCWLYLLLGEFLLHIQCWLHFYVEFLLHIPCWLHFYLGSFSYTSRAGFFLIFIWGVCLTHPLLVSFCYLELRMKN